MTANANKEKSIELNFSDIESKKYLSMGEVESLLGTYRQTIYTYFKNNTITKYTYEGKVYISKDDIDILGKKINFNKERRKKKEINIIPNDTDKENKELIDLKLLLKKKEDEIEELKEKNYNLEQSNGELSSKTYDLYEEIKTLCKEINKLKEYKSRLESTLGSLNEKSKEADILYSEKNQLIIENTELKASGEYKNLYFKLYNDFKELKGKHDKLEEDNKNLTEELNQLKIKTSMNDEYKNLYTALSTNYANLQKEKDKTKDNQISLMKEVYTNLHRDIETLINTTKDTQFLLAQQQLEASKESAITIESEKESLFKKIFKK